MTTLAAPTVTDVADGISIPVDMMPDETGGFQLFRVNADGSWTSLYYRGNWIKDFKTTPIRYPFVEPGKTCRYIIQFYGLDSHTKAVSNQFTVTPANGLGEISISNGDAITLNVTNDGKFSMGAVPEFSGKGAASITGSSGDFEFWKGNGFASESAVYITGTSMPTTELTAQHDMFFNLVSNPSVPLLSGSKFFVHFVLGVNYGDDYYRVFERESEVHTITYDERWRSFHEELPCIYTNEQTATGAKITVTSDSENEGVYLMYVCNAAQGKSCTFTITVKNTSSTDEYVSPWVNGVNARWGTGVQIPAGTEKTITINDDEDHIVTVNPVLNVNVRGGSFEISNPVVIIEP